MSWTNREEEKGNFLPYFALFFTRGQGEEIDQDAGF